MHDYFILLNFTNNIVYGAVKRGTNSVIADDDQLFFESQVSELFYLHIYVQV